MGRTFSEIGTNVRDYIEVILKLRSTLHSIPKEHYGRNIQIPIHVGGLGSYNIFNELLHRRTPKRKGNYDLAIGEGNRYDIVYLEGYIPYRDEPLYMLDRDLSTSDNLVSYYPNYDLPYEIDSTTPEEILFQYSTMMSSHELVGWFVLGEMKRMGVDTQLSVLYNEDIVSCTESMMKVINEIRNVITQDHQS